jgi:hypothetical protein
MDNGHNPFFWELREIVVVAVSASRFVSAGVAVLSGPSRIVAVCVGVSRFVAVCRVFHEKHSSRVEG